MDCFFVLSGFLITGILYDTLDDPHRVRNFYLRRTLRIFPLFYAIFLGLLLLTPFVRWQWTAQWLLWPAYLANAVGFFHPHGPSQATLDLINGQLATRRGANIRLGHFWSLCVEEQFYLLWPWIVFRVRARRALLWIATAGIVLCPIARVVAVHVFPVGYFQSGLLLHSTPFRIDSLLFGAAIALLYRGSHRDRLFAVAGPLAWFAVMLGIVLLHPPAMFWSDSASLFVETIGFSFIALLSAAVILRALIPGSIFYRALSFSPLRWLGRISYGAYVFHDIPHNVYDHLGHGHRPLVSLIALAGTLILATLSYRLLETPFLRLKGKTQKNNETAQVSPNARFKASA